METRHVRLSMIHRNPRHGTTFQLARSTMRIGCGTAILTGAVALGASAKPHSATGSVEINSRGTIPRKTACVVRRSRPAKKSRGAG
jgi:hypothetical protein